MTDSSTSGAATPNPVTVTPTITVASPEEVAALGDPSSTSGAAAIPNSSTTLATSTTASAAHLSDYQNPTAPATGEAPVVPSTNKALTAVADLHAHVHLGTMDKPADSPDSLFVAKAHQFLEELEAFIRKIAAEVKVDV